MQCLKLAHLTLKLTKCELSMKEIEFLGFVINECEIQLSRRIVNVIAEFPTPKNVHEVRRYLGLTSFFRRFIPNFATHSEPLTKLTRQNVKFQ